MAGKSNLLFWGVVAVVCIGVGASFMAVKGKVSGTASIGVSGQPRTETPMEKMTAAYERKDFADKTSGRDLAYFWFQPKGAPYPPGLKFPLVLMLHGAPGNAYAGEYLTAAQNQVDFPAFIVVPVLPAGMKWAQPATFPEYPHYQPLQPELAGLPAAVRLVAALAQQYPVDTTRVYVIGCSEGGIGTYGAVKDYGDIFAGAVPLSGIWTAADAKDMRQTPMWAFHGAQDPIYDINVTRRMVQTVRQLGGKATLTEYPDMSHECSNPKLYNRQMWQWLFSQHK